MALTLTAFPLAVWERDGLAAALRKAGLTADDVTAAGALFWRFTIEHDIPAGFGGLEIYGADALMRSVVTLPPLRGRGIGAAIISGLEAEARVAKCRSVYVLTTTAQRLFERVGYTKVERAQVPTTISATTQFTLLCPDSAAVMFKRLG